MPTRRRSTPLDPFTAWTRLAFQAGETMLAAAQVIAHRTSRMSAAATHPHPHDPREFALMGQEKLDAAVECAGALARHAAAHNWQDAARMMQASWRVGMDLGWLMTSSTPAQALQRQARLMQGIVRSAGTAQQASASALTLSRQLLAPLHRRTTANRRRLARVRR